MNAPASAPRIASHQRRTGETDIAVTINIDGQGKTSIRTGIGFLDHMLDSLARHALFDLDVQATGDLHIDGHHVTEDVGIVMGLAFAAAVGSGAGIARFGHALIPMDEALSRAAVDISRRPYLVFNVRFTREHLGDMETELFREWFAAFTGNAGICAHVENIYGTNNHHIIESCFKAFARALRDALSPDPRLAGAIASTKGSLGS